MSKRHPGSKFYAQLNPRRWARARKVALDAAGWRCSECRRPGRLEVHHIVPLEKGGAAYELGNLRVLCVNHHILLHRTHKFPSSPAKKAWKALVEELSSSS